ncbi:MAG TPA: TIGR02678 family protein [Pirellulales bacterium]|nr:TIGR02678 family protein [Pirellulales bacterium]
MPDTFLPPSASSWQASPHPAALGVRLAQATEEERQRALRALLRQPLLAARGPYAAEFGLVRRHAAWLREWLAHHPHWALRVDTELARLRKTPADLSDGTRPARDEKNDAPFSRRRYVLLCLALAALERSDRQTTLGKLAEEIVAFTAADPSLAAAGVAFDLTSRDQRRDLVHVIRLLLEFRVLLHVHGDEQQYVSGSGDVLYDINRPALSAMLNVKRGPSTIAARGTDERIAALVEEPAPTDDEGRNRRLRTRLLRRLLDDPVVYFDDLTADELAYLTSQRSRLLRLVETATGLSAEVRAEGIALVDPRGDLTDLGLPEEGTDGHVTLLLAEYLALRAREAPGTPVSEEALRRHMTQLIAAHRGHWRRGVTEPGAESLLVAQTIERLEALRLARRTADGVVPRAAIGRYALASNTSPTATENSGLKTDVADCPRW